MTVELDGVVGNITYSLKLKKRNVLCSPFFCFSWCQAMLTKIELLLIKPTDALARSVPQTVDVLSGKKERCNSENQRTNRLGRDLDA